MILDKIKIVKYTVIAGKLSVIGHPMRLAIVELLAKNGNMNVTEIYSTLNIVQANASHHLNILKNKGLLNSKRDGKKTIYSIKIVDIIKIIKYNSLF